MNNNNAEQINMMGHRLVDELQNMGHEFINTAMSVSVPIINTMAGVTSNSRTSTRTSTSTSTSNSNVESNIKFYRKDLADKILICCEIPGVSKENCKINYSNKMLTVSGTSSFTDEWDFVKNKEYYLKIDIGNRTNNDIKVKYEHGLLKIHIKTVEEVTSNIDID